MKRSVLTLIGFLGLGAIVALVLLFVLGITDADSVIGLAGVLVGGALSTVSSVLIHREQRRLMVETMAFEKRLQSYQLAYSCWLRMMDSLGGDDQLKKATNLAYDFWLNHSLYLDAKTRDSFWASFHAAKSWMRFRHQGTVDEKKEVFEKVRQAGRHLVEAVDLPPLPIDESGGTGRTANVVE